MEYNPNTTIKISRLNINGRVYVLLPTPTIITLFDGPVTWMRPCTDIARNTLMRFMKEKKKDIRTIQQDHKKHDNTNNTIHHAWSII